MNLPVDISLNSDNFLDGTKQGCFIGLLSILQ